jgi:hypothetical protein
LFSLSDMSGAIQLSLPDPPADTQTGCACTFYLVFKEPIYRQFRAQCSALPFRAWLR